MSEMKRPTRRHVLAAFLFSTILRSPGDAFGASGDQGIGGTGFPARRGSRPGTDQGIGGTGILGIVRGFGSIIVNGVRVSYPRNVPVFYDGRSAQLRDVRIGQGVSVVATSTSDGLLTTRIDIASETSGIIERRRRNGFVILGQIVWSADRSLLDGFETGNRVAVHGLRRLDGSIEATLIEAIPASAPDRVVGRLDWRGRAVIGALPIEGVSRSLAGRRIVVEGRLRDGRMRAARIFDPLGDLAAKVDRVLVESYVGTSKGAFALGAGFPVRGRPIDGPKPGPERRGVLSGTIGDDGHLRPDTLRADPGYPSRSDDRRSPEPTPHAGPRPSGPDKPSDGDRRPPGGPGRGQSPRGETGRGSGGNPPGSGVQGEATDAPPGPR